jgi:quercetin dioxygenase-like cupin family protein
VPREAKMASHVPDVPVGSRPRNLRFDPERFRWAGVGERAYKASPGQERGMGWQGLTRHTLVTPGDAPVGFEVRYFEIAPGGWSSLEKHRHVHVVTTIRGRGIALIGDEVVELAPFDVVQTPPDAPHRWLNAGEEPFGFLCAVDGERDRPRPLSDAEWDALAADPRTARFVF